MQTKITRRALEAFFIIGVVCLPVSQSFLQGSVLSRTRIVERQGKVDALYDALDDSKDAHGAIPDATGLRKEGEEELAQAEKDLLELGRHKAEARKILAERIRIKNDFEQRYGIDSTNQEEVNAFIETQTIQVSDALKAYARLQFLSRSHTGAFGVLSTALTASLSQHIETQSRIHALRSFRMQLFSEVTSMRSFPQELALLQGNHEELLEEYHGALEHRDAAEEKIAFSDARLAEIKRIVAKVDQKIRQMQVELSEYDERIRSRAEHDLLEKGLLSGPTRKASLFSFMWPVVGRITAVFYDEGYMQYFGVPHKAIDISQRQGSPVRAASDGIVYYVQHGGARGYSYVLLGHQRGYATLYGHLSSLYVSAGEDVYAGQIIGLSGGLPGTNGAGPMTTGAHLHFEVIHNGVHIDPRTLLP